MGVLADVIVLGIVSAVRDGAQYGNFEDEFSDINSVVFDLKMERVIKCEVRPDEAVYFPLMVPDGIGVAVWQNAIPAGTPVVAYLQAQQAPTPREPPGSMSRNPGQACQRTHKCSAYTLKGSPSRSHRESCIGQ